MGVLFGVFNNHWVLNLRKDQKVLRVSLREPQGPSTGQVSVLPGRSRPPASPRPTFKAMRPVAELRVNLHFGMSHCEGLGTVRVATEENLVRQG